MSTKKEFKKGYSEFRKKLADAFMFKGKVEYSKIWLSPYNKIFSGIHNKTVYPVSMKIWSYKHNLKN